MLELPMKTEYSTNRNHHYLYVIYFNKINELIKNN